MDDLIDVVAGGVKKVSSGGHVSAVLTEDNDVYVWGGRAGEKLLFDALDDTPTPIDLDGESFMDVSAGMNHMLILTTGHRLYAVGSGEHGQLGLDSKEAADWTEITLPLKDGQQIVSVHAGYKNSFLLVADGF